MLLWAALQAVALTLVAILHTRTISKSLRHSHLQLHSLAQFRQILLFTDVTAVGCLNPIAQPRRKPKCGIASLILRDRRSPAGLRLIWFTLLAEAFSERGTKISNGICAELREPPPNS